jgi:hypothetical protein
VGPASESHHAPAHHIDVGQRRSLLEQALAGVKVLFRAAPSKGIDLCPAESATSAGAPTEGKVTRRSRGNHCHAEPPSPRGEPIRF